MTFYPLVKHVHLLIFKFFLTNFDILFIKMIFCKLNFTRKFTFQPTPHLLISKFFLTNFDILFIKTIFCKLNFTKKFTFQATPLLFIPVIDLRVQLLLCLLLTCIFVRRYIIFWRELVLAIIISFLVTLAPVFNFFFTSTISCMVLFLSVDKYLSFRRQLALNLWIFLYNMGFIDYFVNLYFKFFSQSNKQFYCQTFVIYGFCLLYLWLSKYLFLHKNTTLALDMVSHYLLYVGLILGLIAIYIRSLLFLSIFVVDLRHIYHFGDLEEKPVISDEGKTKPGGNSWLSFHKHAHQHTHYENVAPKTSFFRRAGLGIAFLGLGVTGYAAYQQRLQTIAAQEALKVAQESLKVAQESLNEQLRNNLEMNRQNDLEEVSQGLRSKEDYLKKYGPN